MAHNPITDSCKHKLKQRAAFRNKYQHTFGRLINSNKFKTIMKSHNLDKYKFEILNKTHRKQVIHILCTQFSKSGGSFSAQLFDLSYIDRQPFMIPLVDHAINTGLSYVSLDGHIIVTVNIIFDEMDKFEIPNKYRQQLSQKYFKMLEMDKELENNDPWYKLLREYKAQGAIKHGEILIPYLTCVRSNFIGQSFYMRLSSIFFGIALGISTVKWRHGTLVHPYMFYIQSTFFYKLFNEQIKGGYQRMTSKLNICEYISEKCETDKWYKECFDKENAFSNVIKRKSDCIGFNVINFTKIRDNYDVFEFLKIYTDYCASDNWKSKL